MQWMKLQMGKNNFNHRSEVNHSEAPMRVRNEILNICRQHIEPKWKRSARTILHSYFKRRLNLHDLGEGCQLGINSKVKNAWLGNFASFGPYCEFNSPAVIGDLTMLSSEVQIIGQDHDFTRQDWPMRVAFPSNPRPITIIESDCWIGSRVTIMEGVRIGRGTIIGAASIVTRSLPPYSIAVGIPARVVRERFEPAAKNHYDEFLYGVEDMKSIQSHNR